MEIFDVFCFYFVMVLIGNRNCKESQLEKPYRSVGYGCYYVITGWAEDAEDGRRMEGNKNI